MIKLKYIFIFIYVFVLHHNLYSWGFYAHKKINELAVYTLPPALFSLYKKHLEYVSEHAVDADKRRHLVKEEACKHYMDVDHYEMNVPLDTIQNIWKDVKLNFDDTITEHGVLPYNIIIMYYGLIKAFEEKDILKIVKISTDMGHYIGDCHVPLHTTANYNGQLTGQDGIHALWESRLPELFNERYDFIFDNAQLIDKPFNAIFTAMEQSYMLKDSVLAMEIKATKNTAENKKFTFEQRGSLTVKVYSKEFCETYHNYLNRMVERRIRAAVQLLGSLWFTAWVQAGQPDFENKEFELNEEEQKALADIENAYKSGEMIGRKEE